MSADGSAAALAANSASVAFIVALRVERASLDSQVRTAVTPFSVLQSGPGAERAARAASAALAAGAHVLVSWGLAGGLAAGLVPGAVVLPRRVRSAAGGSFDADPAWHTSFERALSAGLAPRSEDLVTVPAALATREAKRAAGALGAVAADMESAAIAAVAREAGAPFVALRVIVDAVDDALPPDPERWIDERGNQRLAPALAAAFNPAQWGGLWVLSQRYRAARRTLDRAASLLAVGNLHPARSSVS